MGSVTGQGYRFERARVIGDIGSDKSFFVITVKDSFKELEEQATDSPRSAARAFHYSTSSVKKRSLKGC